MRDARRRSRAKWSIRASAPELVQLLCRTATRDQAAFSALYRATSPTLYGIVSRILPGGEASEVLQEAYVKIWYVASKFDAAKGSPLGWMATIARNLAIDQARRPRPLSLEDASPAQELSACFEDPLAGRERQEAYAALLRCLNGLEDKQREMILLAYCRGASREALAAEFNVPVGTVKTWLRQSLAQLRRCLSS